MADLVKLIGLDFGTTTSSAVAATARLLRSAVTGRVELADVRESYRSEMVFTPFDANDRLDLRQVAMVLDGWLAAANVRPDEVFGGGALLTGLTAQNENAAGLVQLIRARLQNTLVATANDPLLESWLAFMGSCAGLSAARPELSVLNLDIGGGTTNIALGKAGEVLHTGCLWIGARHVQVEPGGYRITRLSRLATPMFELLGIRKNPGACLSARDVGAIVDHYADDLEATLLEQPQTRDLQSHELAVTFSGGIGELMYAHCRGEPWPPTTCFGDLGIDLAKRLVESPVWHPHLHRYVPAAAGRATVFGLLRHATEISGSTIFLPDPSILPLEDIPIIGSVGLGSSFDHNCRVFDLVRRSAKGGCVRVEFDTEENAGPPSSADIRALGERLAGIMRLLSFPPAHPVVLLVRDNVAKALGHYATQWGALPLRLIVIDELAARDAHFVHIGRLKGQVVPVSFYGLKSAGGSA